MKYLKKFNTHSEYEVYINGSDKILPNVSLCVDNDEVHLTPYIPPSIIKTTYNVTNASAPTILIGWSPALSQFASIEIDGVEMTPMATSTTLSVGEHNINYTLIDGTKINNYAFSGCTAMTSVSIPKTVTQMNGSVFYVCNGLTKAEFASIESLCNIQFESDTSNPLNFAHHLYIGNDEVTELVIPNSVTSIGKYTFKQCSSITSVTIHNSVTSIGQGAFNGCSGLTSITIPNSVFELGDSAFAACSGLTSVILSNNITKIGYGTFSGCRNLSDITIPSGVTEIGTYAFTNCSGLTSITIPSSVIKIDTYAFQGCKSLTNIDIPNGVITIDQSAFSGCTNLASITLPDSLQELGGVAFEGTAWYNNQSNGLVYAGKFAYKYKGSMPANTSIVLQNDTVGVCQFAFSGCTNLTSITLSNSLTYIGGRAFFGCTGLAGALNLPNSITSIGYSAFQGCTKINGALTIPNNTTFIGASAFTGTKITATTFGSSVETIGANAFSGCTGLTRITSLSTTAPTISNNTFRGVKTNGTLYVPQGSSGYDVWMGTGSYYLGSYNWTKVEQ